MEFSDGAKDQVHKAIQDAAHRRMRELAAEDERKKKEWRIPIQATPMCSGPSIEESEVNDANRS